MIRRSLVLVALLLVVPPGLGGERPLRVLFVGNSLTYTNDLPSIVASLAKYSGGRRLAYETVAYPDYSLEDHWDRGEALSRIVRGRWDVVVLQQGPSASTDGREVLLRYAHRFAEEIRRVGARPAFYMVWPSEARREEDFDRSSESYQLAADETDAILLPAGEGWRAAWRRDPSLRLYSDDGLHPTPAGSYLAALVVYAGLFDRSPEGLPLFKYPPEQAVLLQAAAAEATRRFGHQ